MVAGQSFDLRGIKLARGRAFEQHEPYLPYCCWKKLEKLLPNMVNFDEEKTYAASSSAAS